MKNLTKYVPLLCLTLFLCSCRAPGHVKAGEPSLISVGMTKEDVIKKLGKPEAVTADGKTETLNYILERPWWQDKPFRVKIVDGKVQSYEIVER